MAKRFKLRFSLPFQFCRFKQPSSLPHSPLPATYLFSPVNPKASDIFFPNFPEQPPSTPIDHHLFKRQLPSKIRPVSCGCHSRTRTRYVTPQCNTESAEYCALIKEYNPCQKMYNSPVSDDSDSFILPVAPARAEKKKKKEKDRKKKSEASVCMSKSSADGCWFSSSEGGGHIEETESLGSSSRSFDSSYDFGYSLDTISESPISGARRKKKNHLKVRRLRRSFSNSFRGSEKTKATTTPESESPVRKSVFSRLMPCTVDGKVNESFAVVKRSKDPYEDFKRSMLEMILEKQMFEATDLEQLLQCFLSLNSQQHHAVIVEAFSEIWEALFC